jgi:hypothetical protein
LLPTTSDDAPLEQLSRCQDLLSATLHGLYERQPELITHFADAAYWEELSDGLHVTADLTNSLFRSRTKRLVAATTNEQKATSSQRF